MSPQNKFFFLMNTSYPVVWFVPHEKVSSVDLTKLQLRMLTVARVNPSHTIVSSSLNAPTFGLDVPNWVDLRGNILESNWNDQNFHRALNVIFARHSTCALFFIGTVHDMAKEMVRELETTSRIFIAGRSAFSESYVHDIAEFCISPGTMSIRRSMFHQCLTLFGKDCCPEAADEVNGIVAHLSDEPLVQPSLIDSSGPKWVFLRAESMSWPIVPKIITNIFDYEIGIRVWDNMRIICRRTFYMEPGVHKSPSILYNEGLSHTIFRMQPVSTYLRFGWAMACFCVDNFEFNDPCPHCSAQYGLHVTHRNIPPILLLWSNENHLIHDDVEGAHALLVQHTSVLTDMDTSSLTFVQLFYIYNFFVRLPSVKVGDVVVVSNKEGRCLRTNVTVVKDGCVMTNPNLKNTSYDILRLENGYLVRAVDVRQHQ